MRPATADPAQLWDIATPTRPNRLPGVSMAGFHARGTDPVDLSVVPYPAVTVAINIGASPLAIDDGTGPQRHDSAVLGLGASGISGRGQGIDCLQIRLSPLVAHAVFGTGLDGQLISLDDVWGRAAERVRQQLHAANSWDERFAILAATIAQRAETGRPTDPEVAAVWQRMVANRGGIAVERLADEVGWSRKRLWSRFRAQLGLTPKRAAGLVRFDHAVHRLAAGHRAALVAAELGYVDQSHLCRDMRTFGGGTPTAMAVAPWLAVDEVAWSAPAYLAGTFLQYGN